MHAVQLPRPPAGDNMAPIVRKLKAVVALSQAMIARLDELQSYRRRVSAGTDLIIQGESCDSVHIVCEGWAIGYKLLGDGRRQVLNFILPGDLIGFPACLLDVADRSVAALTNMTVATIPAGQMHCIARTDPELDRAFQWAAAREHSILAEHVVNIGRRTAYERLSHLLLELLNRLRLVGLATEQSYHLPLTQEVLADALGLTIVHVNRTLRKLREHGFVRVEKRRVFISDVRGLEDAAHFESGYLDQSRDRHGRCPAAGARLAS